MAMNERRLTEDWDWLEHSVAVLRRITNWGGDGYLNWLNVDRVAIEGGHATARIQVHIANISEPTEGGCAMTIELLPQYRINILGRFFPLDETIKILEPVVGVHRIHPAVVQFRELPLGLKLIEADDGLVIQRQDNTSDLVLKVLSFGSAFGSTPFAVGSAERRCFVSTFESDWFGSALQILLRDRQVTAWTFSQALMRESPTSQSPTFV